MGFHPEWSEIAAWLARSDRIFVKKLARNDCSWADDPENKHQGGFYIPREIRESGFLGLSEFLCVRRFLDLSLSAARG